MRLRRWRQPGGRLLRRPRVRLRPSPREMLICLNAHLLPPLGCNRLWRNPLGPVRALRVSWRSHPPLTGAGARDFGQIYADFSTHTCFASGFPFAFQIFQFYVSICFNLALRRRVGVTQFVAPCYCASAVEPPFSYGRWWSFSVCLFLCFCFGYETWFYYGKRRASVTSLSTVRG